MWASVVRVALEGPLWCGVRSSWTAWLGRSCDGTGERVVDVEVRGGLGDETDGTQ